VCKVGVGLFLLWSLAWVADAQQGSVPENELKAAILYNFAKYVEWPAGALAEPPGPLVLCIVGDHPFGDALAQIEGRPVQERPLAIHLASEVDSLGTCNVVFLCSSESRSVDAVLERYRDQSVLTVADIEGFAQRGGIIDMFMVRDSVGFTVNLDAARNADLVVSSRLLALARIVGDPRPRRTSDN
jgi:hypothetical protein